MKAQLAERFAASFPAPYQPVVGIDDTSHVFEPALLQDTGGRICGGQGMGANKPNVLAREGEPNEGGCGFGGETSPLRGGDYSIRDFDNASAVRRAFEPSTANDGTTKNP